MNEQPTRSKLEIGLEEKAYKIDLEVTDRFQSLSTEISRMALLGMAGYGFLLSNDSKLDLDFHHASASIFCGVAFLAVAVATSLAHRYFSNDALVNMTEFRREVERSNREGAKEHRDLLIGNMRTSVWCLRVASISLALGVVSVAATFWIAFNTSTIPNTGDVP